MTKKTTAAEFKKELIASIQNERRAFDMGRFTKSGDPERPATCGTACCIAGHIEALRPQLAKKLAPKCVSSAWGIDHENLAASIWKEVTGQECRFDFYGHEFVIDHDQWGQVTKDLDGITRKEAIAHINGRSKRWPLLPKGHGEYQVVQEGDHES